MKKRDTRAPTEKRVAMDKSSRFKACPERMRRIRIPRGARDKQLNLEPLMLADAGV